MARAKKIETRRTDNLCEVKVNIDYRNGIIKRQSFYSDISKDDAKKKATALHSVRLIWQVPLESLLA